MPGLLVHGSGHFVAGDRQTARRLLATESIGLSMVLGGIAGLSFTGASRKLVAPFILLTGAGVGTMMVTGLSDLYGVLAPETGWGAPEPPVATTVRLGGLYVRNPTMPYRWLAGAAIESWAGGLRVAPAFYSNLDGQTLRADLRVSYRVRGARPTDTTPAPQHLDVSLGLFHHRERRAPAEFDMTVGDLQAGGRLGLGGWLPSLTGAFAEWGAGPSIGGYHYGGAGAPESAEALLFRFGFGLHFGAAGRRPPGRAAAGVRPPARRLRRRHEDGRAGQRRHRPRGAEGHVMFTRRWGIGMELKAGAAHLVGLSLRWQPSEPRS